MFIRIRKKKVQNPLAVKFYKTQKKWKYLKIRLFLLFTLPAAIIAIGQAVLKEYVKIRVRQAAQSLPAEEKAHDSHGTAHRSCPPKKAP